MLFYFFYFLLSPLFLVLIHIGKFFNKKISIHIENEKKTIQHVIKNLKNIDRKLKKVLLFHATSAGEFEQLKPILKHINRKSYYVIQTFSSPEIYNKEFNNPLFDISCYHPYDFFWKSYFFFKNINPTAYIITRHDIWPFHLLIANKLDIKIFYINANLHKKSIWNQWYISKISKIIFKNITFCFVPSQAIFDYAKEFINERKIIITGDSRFDQIIERYNQNKNIDYLPVDFLSTQNIVFGSYDLYDEPYIIDSISKCYPEGNKSLLEKKHKIILVPHENDSFIINRIIDKLKINHFNVIKFSEIDYTDNRIHILIIDKVGILADIYRYSKLAYVGSGFGRGVHSVTEPAIHNCLVGFGPNIELLDEAKYIYNHNLGYMVSNIDDMCEFINLDIKSKRNLKIKRELNTYMMNQNNISENITHHIISNL